MIRHSQIEIKSDLCTACRACELACHFHHKSSMGTSCSSIDIQLNADNGDLNIGIDNTCDSCMGEDEPLCVAFCILGALTVAV